MLSGISGSNGLINYCLSGSLIIFRLTVFHSKARRLSVQLQKERINFLDKNGRTHYSQLMFTHTTVMVKAHLKAAWRATAVAEGGFY